MRDLDHIKKTFVMARHCPTAVACVWSLVRYHEGDTEPWLLTAWSGTKEGQTNMSGLLNAVHNAGFEAIARRLTLNQLEIQVFPLIIFVEKDDGIKDFVICYGFDGRRFLLGDTSWGLMMCYPEEVRAMWIGGITLDLFAGDHFIGKKQHRKCYQEFLLGLSRLGCVERQRLLEKWTADSVCDAGMDVRWFARFIPVFCMWNILNILLWILGICAAIYLQAYWTLCGWLGMPLLVWGIYKLGLYWRESCDACKWGRLKDNVSNGGDSVSSVELEQRHMTISRSAVWSWRVGTMALLLSVLAGLSSYPNWELGIGVGLVSFSLMNSAFIYIRMTEIAHTLYWISIELRKKEESKLA